VPKPFAKGSPAFNDETWKKAAVAGDIEGVIAEGRKRMPAFRGKLTPEQIRSVAAYLMTL
jgi:mono/diheme cytochrome c family protein